MGILKEVFNEDKTELTITKSVVDSSTPFGYKIIKSTENLDGIKWREEDGTLKKGVWNEPSDETVLYARIITDIITLSQVQENKTAQFNQEADNTINKISIRKTAVEIEAEKTAILDNLTIKLKALNDAETLQDAERIVLVEPTE